MRFSLYRRRTFGNSRRNDYSGPNLAQLDMTVSKSFRATERLSFEFRADTYNVLNHPNYANPGTVRVTATGTAPQPGVPFSLTNVKGFGQLTSTVGNQVGIGANRQVQLALRASF